MVSASPSSSAAGDTHADAPRTPLAWLALAGVLAVTLAVFLRATSGELVYVDLLMIARNPNLGELAQIPSLFAQPYWDFLASDDHSGYWRPLTAVVLSLAHAAGDGSTVALHAAGIAAHLAATAAAFLVARRLLRSTALAALTSLLFGLHPLHVEAVAWITAVNDPLYGCFALLSLHAWCRWRDRGSTGVPVWAAVWFAVALLGKEAAVVVPLLAWIIDWGRKETSESKRGFGVLGLVLLAYYLVRVFVFESPWAGLDLKTTGFGVDRLRLMLLRVEVFGGALELLTWPLHLNLFRAFRPEIPYSDPALVRALLWTLAFLAFGAWFYLRQRRLGFLALGFIIASLAPMLVAPESLWIFPLSDRFLYLAVFGMALGLTALVAHLTSKRGAIAALSLVAILYSVQSYDRIGVWQNEETLFRDAAAGSPRSPYVQWGLGRVLLARYRETGDEAYLDEAFRAYIGAQNLLLESRERPTDVFASSRDFLQANLGYGWCELLRDRAEGFHGSNAALGVFQDLEEKIVAINQRTQEARALGIRVRDPNLELEQVYTAVGVAYMEGDAFEEAEEAFNKALIRNNRYPEAHLNMGRLFSRQGEWTLARRHFERALEERPGDYETRLLFAQALHSEDKLDEAETQALALLAAGNRPEPFVVLGAIDLVNGRLDEAIVHLESALSADVTHGQAWNLRAQALLLRGDQDPAIRSFRRAIELMPNDFHAHYNFGVVLINTGAVEAGLPVITRAYDLCEDDKIRTQLRLAIEAIPIHDADMLFALASIDGRRGSLAGAQAWLERAFEIDPNHIDSWFQRGRLLQGQGRHEEALAAMRKACPLENTSFVGHVELGGYLGQLDQIEEALRHLERARELGPPAAWNDEVITGARSALAELIQRLSSLGDYPGSVR